MKSVMNLCSTAQLERLRQFDIYRTWHSLDDERYCLVCEKTIAGHEILFCEETADQPAHLQCPTSGCVSIPMDWVIADL